MQLQILRHRAQRVCGFLAFATIATFGFQNCGGFRPTNQFGSLSSSSTAVDPAATSSTPEGTSTPPISTKQPDIADPGALQVCPTGCAFQLPSQAVAVAADRQIIDVQAADYNDCIVITQNHLTIRGLNGRAHLHGKVCLDKGVIVTEGSDTILENLEISDYANSSQNAAGIRHDASASNLIAKNLYFHDGEFGFLGSNVSTTDNLVFDGCIFDKVGLLRDDGEISVPIFTSASARLLIRNSKITNTPGGASNIKSRAEQTVIDCSVIATQNGSDSYAVDLYSSPNVIIENSVIEHGSSAQNGTLIAYGTSGSLPATDNRISIVNNVFLNDLPNGTFVRINQASNLLSLDISGNTWIGAGTPQAGGGAQPNNASISNRTAAGVGESPALPLVKKCSTPPI